MKIGILGNGRFGSLIRQFIPEALAYDIDPAKSPNTKVDPTYLQNETEIVDPVRIKIIKTDNSIIRQLFGESAYLMADDGATFIFQKDIAYELVKRGAAELV